MDDASVQKVILPAGIEEIQARAFAGTGLTEIVLPESLTFIDATAFDGPEKVTARVRPGTYAALWAKDNGYIIDTGACGEQVNWMLENDGLLTIRGTGAMPDYEELVAPSFRRDAVRTVVVEPGITSVGAWTFNGSDNLTAVNLPTTVTDIGYNAFVDCQALARVYYAGSQAAAGAIAIHSGNDALTQAQWTYNAGIGN